ncbi:MULTISPECIES: response regulator [Massilia]|uniref:Response regulator n=1 Tax=Massilia haematophila TaxID=457923 RepID=A0ABV7PIK1_9BURK|nr:response regulator [Massilia sp.]
MKRILLVEDDPAVSYILQRYLEAAGFAVLAAGGGKEALGLFASSSIDLVVTDYRMPGMNGEELLLELRARRPTLPALIVSAYGHELSIRIPGVPVLSKPVDPGVLVELVNNLLLDAETVALNKADSAG